jgi:hypothetical protein
MAFTVAVPVSENPAIGTSQVSYHPEATKLLGLANNSITYSQKEVKIYCHT